MAVYGRMVPKMKRSHYQRLLKARDPAKAPYIYTRDDILALLELCDQMASCLDMASDGCGLLSKRFGSEGVENFLED